MPFFNSQQAYLGPNNGEVRLFRPQKNMERLTRSVERVALPVSKYMMICMVLKTF